jgi:hypothetical protein
MVGVVMNNSTELLLIKAKTFAHHDQRAEWLIWQLALALEEALEKINNLESKTSQ